MQKIQILFPDPVMEDLRALARQEDRPISEVVRRAVERLLETRPSQPAPPQTKLPAWFTFDGGGILVPAERMKDLIYADDEADLSRRQPMSP